jgi:sugar phosphate isomerase/epimerase
VKTHVKSKSNHTSSTIATHGTCIPIGIEIFHFNDYVAHIPQEKQTDNDRVYPGDGIAPWSKIMQILKEMGTPKVLSLELFNKDYWKQDPLEVAKTGLIKMKKVVETGG